MSEREGCLREGEHDKKSGGMARRLSLLFSLPDGTRKSIDGISYHELQRINFAEGV